MKVPKNPTEVFSYICHFIFAIIITTSYESANEILINPEKPFLSDSSLFIPSTELFLAYTIIVSGWVGYSRSMIKWPHTDTKYGAFRFCLDLAILFCYFGIITLTNLQHDFREYFLGWVMGLFILFSMSDAVKIKEYYKRKGKDKKLRLRIGIGKTFIFTVIIGMIVYVIHDDAFKIKSELLNEDIGYFVYLVFIMFLMVTYRWWKWPITPQNRRPVK